MQTVHTLIIGSGAAGLCAAVRLKELGISDILLTTEGLGKGTSINAGSDKQTYYKLSLCGNQMDSPYDLAKTLFDGGSMHGDIALAEAALSARCFLHLVNLGVKFPTDAFGQFAGYKTDHDPRQRATSAGPYTSRDMCAALIRRVKELHIPLQENVRCVQLLKAGNRVCGAVFCDSQNKNGELIPVLAENIVFAVGGPGNLYEHSVYPVQHSLTSIGLALAIGAEAHNLQESQFGLASIKFRWNVSGTYMQVIPRFISTDANGNDEREFLSDYFDDPNELFSNIFLKGYQWPFNVRAASSFLDIFVHMETLEKRRRVFLDFRHNPVNLSLAQLDSEAKSYLEKSEALFGTPFERLEAMNPAAIQLFADHGIDLRIEPLEIAVCAQHNNGGLAGTHWWESTNIKHLFPIGEVNGSHGVARPGGAALNAGQAGAFRAAEFIANCYADWTLDVGSVKKMITERVDQCSGKQNENRTATVQAIRQMMSQFGGMIRSSSFESSAEEAAFCLTGSDDSFAVAARVYLDAIRFSAAQTGSRGSGLVLNGNGVPVHPKLGQRWKMQLENEEYRKKVLVSSYDSETGTSTHRWEECRPIPQSALWFETFWKEYREGIIYGTSKNISF